MGIGKDLERIVEGEVSSMFTIENLACVLLDKSTIAWANVAAATLFGLSVEDFIGQNLDELGKVVDLKENDAGIPADSDSCDDIVPFAPFRLSDDYPIPVEPGQEASAIIEKLIDAGCFTSLFQVRFALQISITAKKTRWLTIIARRVDGPIAETGESRVMTLLLLRDISDIVEIPLLLTEKQQAEQKLLDEQQKFQVIAEQSALGIVLVQDREIIYVNERLASMFEMSTDELYTKRIDEMLGSVEPSNQEMMQARLEQHGEGKVPDESRYTIEMRTPSGAKKHLEIISRPISLNGRPAALGMVLDITEKVRYEAQIVESEEKFRTIAEKSSVGVIIHDGKVRYVNDRAAWIYGYTIDEMLAWTDQHLLLKIHPDDRSSITEYLRRDLGAIDDHRQGRKNVTFRIIAKDGSLRWVNLFTSAIKFQDNKAELLVLIDITDVQVAELKLKESEEKYREIFQNSTAAILLLTQKGAIVECNPAAERLFSMAHESLMKLKIKDLDHMCAGKDTPSALVRRANVDQVAGPVDFEVNAEGGRHGWIQASATRITFGKDHVIQLIINDITTKVTLGLVFEEENKKLRQLVAMRRNFIETATHELKTPLVSLYSASQFLLSSLQSELGPNAQALLEIVFRGATRMKELVEGLLDISRLETGNFQLSLQEIDLAAVTTQVLTTVEYLVKANNHELLLDMPENVIVLADKMRIEQVITNLVTNAIKNTPIGGTITIRLSSGDDMATFSIQDSGIGLTPEEMQQLFTQFGRFDRSDVNTAINIQGSGLGLFISKNIIEAHGGRIWAESPGRNEGSTFSFEIPLAGHLGDVSNAEGDAGMPEDQHDGE
jgi:PAS domain S-box-containing protein